MNFKNNQAALDIATIANDLSSFIGKGESFYDFYLALKGREPRFPASATPPPPPVVPLSAIARAIEYVAKLMPWNKSSDRSPILKQIQTISDKAINGDNESLSLLVTMATLCTAELEKIARHKPKMVAPFASVTVAWPISRSIYPSHNAEIKNTLQAIDFGKNAGIDSKSRLNLSAGATKLAFALLVYMKLIRMGILQPSNKNQSFIKNCKSLGEDMSQWWDVAKPELENSFKDEIQKIVDSGNHHLKRGEAVERVRKAFMNLVK